MSPKKPVKKKKPVTRPPKGVFVTYQGERARIWFQTLPTFQSLQAEIEARFGITGLRSNVSQFFLVYRKGEGCPQILTTERQWSSIAEEISELQLFRLSEPGVDPFINSAPPLPEPPPAPPPSYPAALTLVKKARALLLRAIIWPSCSSAVRDELCHALVQMAGGPLIVASTQVAEELFKTIADLCASNHFPTATLFGEAGACQALCPLLDHYVVATLAPSLATQLLRAIGQLCYNHIANTRRAAICEAITRFSRQPLVTQHKDLATELFRTIGSISCNNDETCEAFGILELGKTLLRFMDLPVTFSANPPGAEELFRAIANLSYNSPTNATFFGQTAGLCPALCQMIHTPLVQTNPGVAARFFYLVAGLSLNNAANAASFEAGAMTASIAQHWDLFTAGFNHPRVYQFLFRAAATLVFHNPTNGVALGQAGVCPKLAVLAGNPAVVDVSLTLTEYLELIANLATNNPENATALGSLCVPLTRLIDRLLVTKDRDVAQHYFRAAANLAFGHASNGTAFTEAGMSQALTRLVGQHFVGDGHGVAAEYFRIISVFAMRDPSAVAVFGAAHTCNFLVRIMERFWARSDGYMMQLFLRSVEFLTLNNPPNAVAFGAGGIVELLCQLPENPLISVDMGVLELYCDTLFLLISAHSPLLEEFVEGGLFESLRGIDRRLRTPQAPLVRLLALCDDRDEGDHENWGVRPGVSEGPDFQMRIEWPLGTRPGYGMLFWGDGADITPGCRRRNHPGHRWQPGNRTWAGMLLGCEAVVPAGVVGALGKEFLPAHRFDRKSKPDGCPRSSCHETHAT
ncbi:hypothetical protein PAPYR_9564 [Paratrimastix pyriformis]|uniref:Uncharacterized protein n=1 Tax=Paratrimastix pyriformis TaxID=342808 RepID=A0ABQ8U830_9EUKA|nr:hypothetical protein PAPYR_9564 [Paratrimastix pyriformis]